MPKRAHFESGGRFVFAAWSALGRLASYRLDGRTGMLTPLATYPVGQGPMAVLAVRPGD